MNKPHKHAALIKAWADGAEIQELFDGTWRNTFYPRWHETTGYFRIKPTPTPDIVCEKYCYLSDGRQTAHFCEGKSNVKFTFDGDTGKLKAVELIK